MPPRTHHDTRPVLATSAFVRLVCDGRVIASRAIPTLTALDRAGRTTPPATRGRRGRPANRPT